MSMEKSLYQAPQGIQALTDEPAIEIEIEDPESVSISMDGLEISMEKDDEGPDDFDANLAEDIDDSTLASIVGDLIGDYEDDIASRRDWIRAYVDGLELLLSLIHI